MLYANDSSRNNTLSQPTSKHITYFCPDCGNRVIPRFCTLKTPHFAHQSNVLDCGSRYHDSKSEWHLTWQLTIKDPQGGINIEVPVTRDGTIYKRADLKPPHGIIIEFQKSPLPIGDRKERETVYRRMIWVVHPEIEYSKTWFVNQSETIPVFIDRGDYLEHPSMIGGKISRQDFIDKIVNGPILHFYMFRQEYWINISSSFEYYNQIEAMLECQRLAEEERIRLEINWELQRPMREAREKAEAEERKRRMEQIEKDRIEYEERQRIMQEESDRILQEWKLKELKEWEAKIIPVYDVMVERHQKIGRPDTLHVMYIFESAEYFLGRRLNNASSYLSLESAGPSGIIAQQRIRQFGGKAKTISDAFYEHQNGKWRKIKAVQVKGKEDGYLEVTGFVFWN